MMLKLRLALACLAVLPLAANTAQPAPPVPTSPGPAPSDNAEASARTFSDAARAGKVVQMPALRYIVVRSGPSEGRHPTRSSAIQIRFTGTFPDGTIFYTSKDKGGREDGTAIFPLRAVIPGFAAAVQKMVPGDEWIVYVPKELGYGQSGPMAGKDLIFRIALIGFAEMPASEPPTMKELPKP